MSLWLLLLSWGCGKPAPKPWTPPPKPTVTPAPAPEIKVETPKPTLDAELFPHHPGNAWEMEEMREGKTYQLTLTTRDVREEANKTAFTVEMQRDGEVVQREQYEADATGVYRMAAGKDEMGRIEPPMPMLQFPLHSGSAWGWKGAFRQATGSTAADAAFKWTGPETIQTPAGSFQAYRLDQTLILTLPEGKRAFKTAQWFAPKVGLVKQTTEDGAQPITAALTKQSIK